MSGRGSGVRVRGGRGGGRIPRTPPAPVPFPDVDDVPDADDQPAPGGNNLIPKPEKFDGRGDVRNFVFAVKLYITALGRSAGDAQRQLLIVGGFFAGYALTWFRMNHADFTSVAEMLEQLEEFYGDKNPAERAREKIDNLQQLGSVERYIHLFTEAAVVLGKEYSRSAEAYHRFTSGLKKPVRTEVKVRMRGSTDLKEAMKIANEFDRASHSDSRPFEPRPARINAINNKPAVGTNDNFCYQCKKHGHFKRDCPEFKCHKCGLQGHYAMYCNTNKVRWADKETKN